MGQEVAEGIDHVLPAMSPPLRSPHAPRADQGPPRGRRQERCVGTTFIPAAPAGRVSPRLLNDGNEDALESLETWETFLNW